jgi:hypothetical protein
MTGAAQHVRRRQRVPNTVAFVIQVVGFGMIAHDRFVDLDQRLRVARLKRPPISCRGQFVFDLNHYELTPFRNTSMTRSAIGSSL